MKPRQTHDRYRFFRIVLDLILVPGASIRWWHELGHAEIVHLDGRDPGVRHLQRHQLRAALGGGDERARIGRQLCAGGTAMKEAAN